MSFIQNMAVFPFTLDKDWEYARSRSDPWTPQPLITVPVNDFPRLFPVLKTVFCRLKKSGIVRWKSPAELQVLRAGFKEVSFHGKWTEEEMHYWLQRATISRCEYLTDEMYALLNESGKPVVHFFIEREMTWSEFWPWIQLFPSYQYTYLPHDPENPFVEHFHARNRKPPIVIHYIPGTNASVLYEGPVKPQDIGDWLAELGDPQGPPPVAKMTLRGQYVILGGVFVAVAVIVAACFPSRKRGSSGRSPAAIRQWKGSG
jgi:hypothetical protein